MVECQHCGHEIFDGTNIVSIRFMAGSIRQDNKEFEYKVTDAWFCNKKCFTLYIDELVHLAQEEQKLDANGALTKE